MNTIQSDWEIYKKSVLPKNASSIQIAETEQAFYAGAAVMFQAFRVLSDPEVSEAASVQIMRGYNEELEIWFAEKKACTHS